MFYHQPNNEFANTFVNERLLLADRSLRPIYVLPDYVHSTIRKRINLPVIERYAVLRQALIDQHVDFNVQRCLLA